MKKLLVTGSSGLIGSEVCVHFAHLGWEIHGIDNNQRAVFWRPGRYPLEPGTPADQPAQFSPPRTGCTQPRRPHRSHQRNKTRCHRAYGGTINHDRAAAIPFDDFDINAAGTLNLLETTAGIIPTSLSFT